MSLIDYCFVGLGTTWPVLLGGQAHWTVGLVATLISISSIIAADTFAFIGGKVYNLISLQKQLFLFCPSQKYCFVTVKSVLTGSYEFFMILIIIFL